jgi:hypothetical protein
MQGLEQEKLGLLQLQRPSDTVAKGQQQQKMKLGVQDGGHTSENTCEQDAGHVYNTLMDKTSTLQYISGYLSKNKKLKDKN